MNFRHLVAAFLSHPQHDEREEQILAVDLVDRVARAGNNDPVRFTIDNTHMGGGMMRVHEFVKSGENIMVFAPNGRVVIENLSNLLPIHYAELTAADFVPFVMGYLRALGDVQKVTIIPNRKEKAR